MSGHGRVSPVPVRIFLAVFIVKNVSGRNYVHH